MKIGILAAGVTPDALLTQYGTYAQMIATLLQQANSASSPQKPPFEFAMFDVRDGMFPASCEECDAWVITGSRANVYENLPWMQQLKTLIIAIDERRQPLVGICFGHQIIAEALGGVVEAYQGGWGVGVHHYQRVANDAAIPANITEFAICAVHQDQVVRRPLRSRVFARSDFCENAGLLYDDHILTLQSHPEFTTGFVVDLIDLLDGATFPKDIASVGRESALNNPIDATEVCHWLADFLQQAHVNKPL